MHSFTQTSPAFSGRNIAGLSHTGASDWLISAREQSATCFLSTKRSLRTTVAGQPEENQKMESMTRPKSTIDDQSAKISAVHRSTASLQSVTSMNRIKEFANFLFTSASGACLLPLRLAVLVAGFS